MSVPVVGRASAGAILMMEGPCARTTGRYANNKPYGEINMTRGFKRAELTERFVKYLRGVEKGEGVTYEKLSEVGGCR
jgi:hypothetical protein